MRLATLIVPALAALTAAGLQASAGKSPSQPLQPGPTPLAPSPSPLQLGPSLAHMPWQAMKRPTSRLSPAQLDAVAWFADLDGDSLPLSTLEAMAAGLDEAWQAAPDEAQLRARLERVELALLKAKGKGTRDLAWAAQAIYDLQTRGVISPFRWVDDAGDWNRATIRTEIDLLYNRRNNCFCYVNLCAWLVGAQPVSPEGVPQISHLAWMTTRSPGSAPLEGTPARGLVVANAHRMSFNNNEYGFQHTGIVVGDGQVVHLGSRDLRKDPVDAVFARMTRTTYVGPFDWDAYERSGR